jgi:hypothetical protein
VSRQAQCRILGTFLVFLRRGIFGLWPLTAVLVERVKDRRVRWRIADGRCSAINHLLQYDRLPRRAHSPRHCVAYGSLVLLRYLRRDPHLRRCRAPFLQAFLFRKLPPDSPISILSTPPFRGGIVGLLPYGGAGLSRLSTTISSGFAARRGAGSYNPEHRHRRNRLTCPEAEPSSQSSGRCGAIDIWLSRDHDCYRGISNSPLIS